ncbi:MAG: hypothetical protein K5637_05640 [Lachnospiraceae bacterium]|nr:hypothetical protein [Lachnospiraceae bacterium]
MKKKIIIAAAAVVLVIIGAAALRKAAASGDQKTYVISSGGSVTFENATQTVKDIRAAFGRRASGIHISYTSHSDHMSEISPIVDELMGYALEETDDPKEGDYLRHQYGGYTTRYGYTEQNGTYSYEVTIVPDYYTYPEQEKEVDAEVDRIIQSLGFTSSTTDYEKVKAIYDYICDTVIYDRIHAKNPYYHLKTTAYAALINHTAVCQGYAVGLYRLFREAGLSARVITGMAVDPEDGSQQNHAWNIVSVDGRFYNVDATWDDIIGGRDYFLKCSEEFPDHIPGGEYLTDEFLTEYPMAEESYGKV